MGDDRKRLGRSLESLISAAQGRELSMDVIKRTGHRVQAVVAADITPNPFQPRKVFTLEALNELVESLRAHGLMQPIVVRRQEDRFELIAGERRWRASQELGWETIDAVVVEADDRKMLVWALVENIQRETLGPIELALGFKQLASDFGFTQAQVGRAVGVSRPAVANLVRLLELPDEVQESVSRGTISAGAARALLGLSSIEEQRELASHIETQGLNVRDVEKIVREQTTKKGKARRRPTNESPVDPNQQALIEELQATLGTKVSLQGNLKSGRLWIRYHSARELDRLVRRLQGEAPSMESPSVDEGDPQTLSV